MLKNIRLDDLTLGTKLGNGAFGEVFKSKISGSDTIYATKRLEKRKFMKNPKAFRYLENEINILNNISHENIVKLYNSDLQTTKYKYLITEYCNGGDLNGCLEKYKKEMNRPFNEEEVQYIMRQLVSGIKYLHVEKKILHRDLKLENILLQFDNEEDRLQKRILKAKIKIIDFGFARYYDDLVGSVLGSPMFMDPRILYRLAKVDHQQDFGYEEKADIYSLGVICYILLTGKPLFDVDNLKELVDITKKGEFQISADLSKETISFLNYMLRSDPKKRLDIEKLSRHKFITLDSQYFTKIDKTLLSDNLKGSQLYFDLKKSCIGYLKGDIFEEPKQEISDDELNKDLVEKFNKLTLEPKPNQTDTKPDTDINNLDIEKLIWDSIDIINQDGMIIEPKLVPFIPGDDPKILLNEN